MGRTNWTGDIIMMTQAETPNVDAAEIAKFEKLASRWWDRNSEFKPLHDINPLRVGFIDSKVTLVNKRVLDIGCGGGILSEAMAYRGARVTGIDMGEAPLGVARYICSKANLILITEKSPQKNFFPESRNLDVITCLEMLEHVPDPVAIIKSVTNCCNPAAICVSTIHRNPKAWLFAVVGAEYVLRMLPRGTHDYRNSFGRPNLLNGHDSRVL